MLAEAESQCLSLNCQKVSCECFLRNNWRSRDRLFAQPRSTQDIDAVTWLDLAETTGFVKSGARFGFFPRISDPIEFALKSRVLLLQHNQTKIDVDISLGALPFELVSVYPNLDLDRIRHWVGQFAAVLESPELVSDLEDLLGN